MDEDSKIEVKEKGRVIKKYNRLRHYTLKYTLSKVERDKEKIEGIGKLESIKEIDLTYDLTNELLKDLLDGIKDTLKVRKEEKLYFTDEEDTILIPKKQVEEKNTITREFDFTIISDEKLQIIKKNILKLTIELEDVEEKRFYFLMARIE